MKIRNGFVSNSSSSSFVVDVRDLSVDQKQMIVDHIELAKEMQWGGLRQCGGLFSEHDKWDIVDKDVFWELSTFLDNFDMRSWLVDVVGVPEDKIGSDLF
jgi:hypothetical protein